MAVLSDLAQGGSPGAIWATKVPSFPQPSGDWGLARFLPTCTDIVYCAILKPMSGPSTSALSPTKSGSVGQSPTHGSTTTSISTRSPTKSASVGHSLTNCTSGFAASGVRHTPDQSSTLALDDGGKADDGGGRKEEDGDKEESTDEGDDMATMLMGEGLQGAPTADRMLAWAFAWKLKLQQRAAALTAELKAERAQNAARSEQMFRERMALLDHNTNLVHEVRRLRAKIPAIERDIVQQAKRYYQAEMMKTLAQQQSAHRCEMDLLQRNHTIRAATAIATHHPIPTTLPPPLPVPSL